MHQTMEMWIVVSTQEATVAPMEVGLTPQTIKLVGMALILVKIVAFMEVGLIHRTMEMGIVALTLAEEIVVFMEEDLTPQTMARVDRALILEIVAFMREGL